MLYLQNPIPKYFWACGRTVLLISSSTTNFNITQHLREIARWQPILWIYQTSSVFCPHRILHRHWRLHEGRSLQLQPSRDDKLLLVECPGLCSFFNFFFSLFLSEALWQHTCWILWHLLTHNTPLLSPESSWEINQSWLCKATHFLYHWEAN